MLGGDTVGGTLRDSPVVIIGGTRGTGLLIVRMLERAGVPVRVIARDVTRARTTLGAGPMVVPGDLTVASSLLRAVEGAGHVILTAGCRSGYPAREKSVRLTEYDGVVATLSACRNTEFHGRFMYMTSSGLHVPSLSARLLNLWKGNTLKWRVRAEHAIRASTLDYTIIRAGVLVNQPGGRHPIAVTQAPLPLSWRHRIAREDVARIFVDAIDHPRTSRCSFEVVWQRDGGAGVASLFSHLAADEEGVPRRDR